VTASPIEHWPAVAKTVQVTADTLSVDLVDLSQHRCPPGWYPRLAHGTPAERNNWRLVKRTFWNCFAVATLATGTSIPAQTRADNPEQTAIELTSLQHLKSSQPQFLSGKQVDETWTLEPRLTVIDPNVSISLPLNRDSLLGAFLEKSVSRAPSHLQKLKSDLGAGGVLDDARVCATAHSCRYAGVTKIVSMTAAWIANDTAKFAISFSESFERTLRSGERAVLPGGTTWRFTLVRRNSAWLVIRAEAISL
jgi:hypothetical protein